MTVFISHCQKDKAAFSTLCMALKGNNIPFWDPESMQPGASLPEQLREAIATCDLCIFIATPRSLKSKWCSAELGAFWGVGKRVITFIADPTLTDDDLPPQFQGYLWTSDAEKVLNLAKQQIGPKTPDELWYTEWQLGSHLYIETLELYKSENNNLSGTRTLDEVGGKPRIFAVKGFRGMGFDWLEYHFEDGFGGGAIMLHHLGTGNAKGLIIAGDCDISVLRCYTNRWLLNGNTDHYKKDWLTKLGEVNPF